MSTFRHITLLLLNLIFLTGIGLAQAGQVSGKSDTNTPNNSPEERQRRAIQRQQDIFKRTRDTDPNINSGGRNSIPRTPSEKAEIEAKIKENLADWERTRIMLTPPAVYYQKFADKLKNQKWDLGRIFIEKNCDRGKIVQIEEVERCADVPAVKGGGSFYSFRFRNNSGIFGKWWDIHFVGDKFIVGNEIVQGVIAKVGDVEPDKVSKLAETKFLSEFKPKKTKAEVKEQAKLLENGLTVNGFTYSNRAPIELNQTYVLRLVAYLEKGEMFNHYGRKRTGVFGKPNTGFDALIAFKIVGKEKDGSLIFLWKELENESPRHVLAD
jgi:hypothetical protein